MMVVYRLERNGDGPYRFHPTSEIERELKAKLVDAHAFNIQKPCPFADGLTFVSKWGIPAVDKKYVCGCLSEEDLIKWFDGFLEEFKSIGFIVSEYKVSKKNVYIGRSRKQCMFLKPTEEPLT